MTHDTMQIDSQHYREVLSNYPTGVSVVTAVGNGGEPAGMVVGTFTSVSLDPPLVAFLPDKASTSWPKIRAAGKFCANVLSAEQENLCRQFAKSGGKKFDGVSWRESPLGSPLIDEVLAWVDCTIEQTFESGDHYIVVGRVHNLAVERDASPLAFFQGSFGRFARGDLTQQTSADVAHRTAVLFGDGSYRQALIDDLADLGNIGDAELARWYSSRRDIINGLISDYLHDLIDRYNASCAKADSPEARLAALIGASFESVVDHRAAIIVFQNERGDLHGDLPEQINELESRIQRNWISVLQDGSRSGAFQQDLDPALTYRYIRDAIFMAARWWRPDGELTAGDLAEKYLRLFLDGIRRH